ncbi:MAG: hypothetical protein M3N26_05825, partial [Pseudomonadota bacterium]|nr:hypothetical protein [Pseudomonadota bacterium]
MARSPGEDEIAGSEGPAPQPLVPARRHTRRLEDKLLVAFHHACDVADIEVARHLLQVLELILARKPVSPDPHRRRNMEGFVAAHERLW